MLVPMLEDYRTILLSIGLTIAACQSLPGFSRSGDVKDVRIAERLSPVVILVTGGDEIRWTNKLMTPVRITFLDYVLDKVSCRRNFEGHFYSGAEAALQPQESASLCFYKPGTIRYVVRMQAGLRNGGIAESGEVQVGALSEYPFTRNESVTLPH